MVACLGQARIVCFVDDEVSNRFVTSITAPCAAAAVVPAAGGYA